MQGVRAFRGYIRHRLNYGVILGRSCALCHPAGAKRFCGVRNTLLTPQHVRGDRVYATPQRPVLPVFPHGWLG